MYFYTYLVVFSFCFLINEINKGITMNYNCKLWCHGACTSVKICVIEKSWFLSLSLSLSQSAFPRIMYDARFGERSVIETRRKRLLLFKRHGASCLHFLCGRAPASAALEALLRWLLLALRFGPSGFNKFFCSKLSLFAEPCNPFALRFVVLGIIASL